MKKAILIKCFLGLFMFFICLGIRHEITSADCILEPNDEFYREHRDECEYNGRTYTVNGENEEVTSFETPMSDTIKETLASGRELYIDMVYYDLLRNEKWGLYDSQYESKWTSGWIPMKQLTVVYDDISFDEEHQSEFVPYEGELNKYLLSFPVTLYQYPNSEKITRTISKGTIDPVNILNTFLLPEKVYIDINGNKWGYVSTYSWGYCRGWYCISTRGQEANTQGSDISTNNPEPTESVDKGDVDCDGSVTLYDTNWVLKEALNICEFSEKQKNIADMNLDSSVTLDDAKEVLKLSLGIK